MIIIATCTALLLDSLPTTGLHAMGKNYNQETGIESEDKEIKQTSVYIPQGYGYQICLSSSIFYPHSSTSAIFQLPSRRLCVSLTLSLTNTHSDSLTRPYFYQ